MPTRPGSLGRERRVYALVVLAAVLGRVDGALQLRYDHRVVSAGPRPRVRLAGRRSQRVRLRQPAFGGRAARARRWARGRALERAVFAVARPLRLSRACLHAGDAAREGLGRRGGPLSEDRVLAGPAVRRRWANSTTSTPTGAIGSRCRAGTRPAGTSSPSGSRTSASSCGRCRRSPSTPPDAARRGSRLDGYLKFGRGFYRAPEALIHQRVELRWNRDRVWIDHHGQHRRRLRPQLRARRLATGAQDAARAAAGRRADPDHGPSGRSAGAERLRRALRMSPKKPSRRSASGCPTCWAN